MIKVPNLIAGAIMAAMSTASAGEGETASSRVFGRLPDGRTVTEYTLTGESGIRARILDYGAIIRTLEVPDRSAQLADVVLGFDSLDPYTARHPYFGAVVGRYAGRIANGRVFIDGIEISLATNDGAHHLHGGFTGFDRALWSASLVDARSRLVLRHTSPAGEEGFPGTLSVEVTYTLTDNGLLVEYEATTDAATILNLTQHSYFNLSGHAADDVLEHSLVVNADEILELDEASIPTGKLLPVADTPFDFRKAKQIGESIDDRHPQLELANGYDHNWVLAPMDGAPNAVLTDARSGRRLEVYTAQPGIQVYTGNYLDGSITGKTGEIYDRHSGIALETQHFPDSPNHPQFQSTLLRPGETFRSRTEYRFSVTGMLGK